MTADEDDDQQQAGPGHSVRYVAKRLRWDERTVRKYLVPLSEWTRESGQVPVMRLGKREWVPRWWLEETLRALEEGSEGKVP